MTATPRELADAVHAASLARDPFVATQLGVPGHDTEVPDVRRRADDAFRAVLEQNAEAARQIDPAPLSAADRTTLVCVRSFTERGLASLDAALVEHALSPLLEGPSRLFGTASRTRLQTPQQAADYLVRTRRFPDYLEGCLERLREGVAGGRPPVASGAHNVLAQLDGYLSGDGADPLSAVEPPAGWDGARAWREELSAIVSDEVRPVIARYREVVATELLPVARPDEKAGLVHLPRGVEDYAGLVRVHTTLDVRPEQVHQTGRDAVAELREQMTALAAGLGLSSYGEVLEAFRRSAESVSAEEGMAEARAAVARAEAVVDQWFEPPIPPPCLVEPMSEHLARAGMPPHYTPPSLDGSRQGTYWYNATLVGIGGGWERESTAFHEAVPGHHLHLSRTLALPDLPTLQTQSFVTAHAEGWGLYAEVLADEMGLFSDPEQRLGMLGMQMFRAARLVVDTGLHALGWTRDEALTFFRETVPLAESDLVAEVNRYIALPGQALAYLTGQREILRLRADARARLGERFDIRGFHSAVLDAGAVPLPALATAVEAWIERVAA